MGKLDNLPPFPECAISPNDIKKLPFYVSKVHDGAISIVVEVTPASTLDYGFAKARLRGAILCICALL